MCRTPWFVGSVVTVVCLFPPAWSEASAPIRRSLPARIAYSQAIAIGKVTKVEALPPWTGPTVWHPNSRVTVEVSEVLRGQPGRTVVAEVSLDNRLRVGVGTEVILFISEVGKDNQVQVFEGAQGFMLLTTLTKAAQDGEGDKVIHQAIREAIRDAVPPEKGKTPYYADLGPKATDHFLSLADHKNANVRRFVVSMLYDLKKATTIGKELSRALKDQDDQVREHAAYALVRQDYGEHADAVAGYGSTLPANALRREALQFLAKADPVKYDFAGQLRQWAMELKPAPHQLFAATLKRLPRSFHVWIKIDVDADRKVRVTEHARSIQQNELGAFTKLLENLTLGTTVRMPFAAEIVIGDDNGKEFVKVDVY